MELGNMIFGNSRGEYPIERGIGFEEEITRLFIEIDPKHDNGWREYGLDFENDTFFMMPYYWGDCTCGFDDYEFKEKHNENCYQTILEKEKLKNGWKKDENSWLEFTGKGLKVGKDIDIWTIEQKIEEEIMKKLCKEMRIKWNDGLGGAVHCTCDYNKRYKKWLKKIGYPNEHREDCLLVKPNFWHKPSGLKIQWYKYPLRDAYSNQELDLSMFKKIINNCIKSLKKQNEKD